MINPLRLARRLLSLNPTSDKVTLMLTLGTVVIFFCAIWYYFSPVSQSITLVSRTEYVSGLTDGNPTAIWSVKNLEICVRRGPDTPEAADGATLSNVSRSCDTELFDTHLLSDEIEFVWPKDIMLAIKTGEPDEIEVTVKRKSSDSALPKIGNIDLTDNSLLIFPREALASTSVIFLSGEIAFGQVVQPFERRLLRSGRYEIRERLPFRSRPILSIDGDFIVGDRVEVLKRGSRGSLVPAKATAFLTFPEATRLSGFDAVLTTAEKPSFIQIERAGDSIALIGTNWTQRVKADLLPVAISTLLGLLGVSLGIVRSFRN